ncbi:MAG: hypothetical protein V7638_3878 [Acidobacteriota bacterium]|jgi:hypothetical protein
MKASTLKKTKKSGTPDALRRSKLRVIQPRILDADTQAVIENSVVLDLRVHAPSFRKKINSEDIIKNGDRDTDEAGVDPSMVHVSKDLIDKDALCELSKSKGALTRWLWLQEVPLPERMLRGGMYVIPLGLVDKVDDEVAAFIEKRDELLDGLIERYDELVSEARRRLAEHFDQRDYPTPKELRKAFVVDANWRPSLSLPTQLEKVNREIWERQQRKVEAQWQDAAADIPRALAVGYQEIIAHAVSRLGTDEEGKPNVFRDSMVQRINEFLASFEARNITNVEELNRLAKRARQAVTGVTAERLRDNVDTRTAVLKEFERIKGELDKAVVVRRRKFSLAKRA